MTEEGRWAGEREEADDTMNDVEAERRAPTTSNNARVS